MSYNRRVSSEMANEIASEIFDFEVQHCPLVEKRTPDERPREADWLGDSGLELRVSGYVRSMRQAVTLVLAVEKMKRPHRKAIGSEFSDLDLLNVLMEHVNEEHVVLEVSPDLESFESDLSRRRTDEPHSICDTEKKCWVMNELDGRPVELTASMLQGPNISQQVTLRLSTYIPQTQPGLGQPVVLGIGGSNYFLSCNGQRNSPVLELEKVENRDGLKTISRSSEAARFLFYKRDSGSTSTFESAQFPGWFISTARNVDRVRVAMCNGRASAGRVTDFQVSRI
ncbi:interleukin-1 beta-like [Acipenser oxyrinchus oxyrinchus]|uniref:Interleukin-1 n=1 Tax=Acipenser oxyrinchus oxyrinchus TaxID=40147 RepID=A0AAD8CPD0_ACIOX|nr:interleukin-1 beta-like [Acipenser oxyrinchus oxyrinchus]